jgi:LemA protein
LTSTENKIGFARQHYNDIVRDYNTAIQQVPANMIAGTFGFKEEAYFEIQEPEVREVPKVKF